MKVKEFATVISGATPSSKCPEYYDGDIAWFTPKDLSDQGTKHVSQCERYITKAGYDSCSTTMLPAGSVLMSSRAPIGLLAIADVPCCTNQGFKSFDVDRSKCDPEYLYYYLKLHIKEVESLGSGTTFKEVSKESVENYDVTLPDLDVQQQIISVLRDIDSKIANNNAICSNLEAMAKLLYDYWFVQFDFPDENGKPYKSSGGKMVWNDALKREIPAGWEVKRVGDIISTERGISYSTPNIKTGEGVPMLNLATFMPGGGDYKADGLKHYLGDYPKNKVLKPYELIMCNTQQTAIKFETDIIGRAMLVPDIFDGDVVFSHHVNVIRTADENMKYYLLYLFNSDYYHKYISGFTNGTNILGLSFNGVEDYLTESPSADILKMFGERVLEVEKKKSEIFLENQQLASLRDFLLPMLMNGQVKVGA